MTVIRAQLAAYNRHDVEGMLSFYAEDAVILDREGGVIYAEAAAMRKGFAELFARMPDLRADYHAPIEVGEWVAVLCVAPNWRTADGSEKRTEWLEIFRVVDGKIRQFQIYQ